MQVKLPGWPERARRAASAPPLTSRAPLLLAGHEAPIGSIEPTLAQRLADAGLPLARRDAAWVVAGPGQPSLAAIARWLHVAGLCTRWRDELLPIRDASDASIGSIERSVVRALGIPTFAAHLVGSTPDGLVWVQQRAFDKATDPGAWDTLVGGLIGAGETTEVALARETAEEAGLVLADLQGLSCAGRIAVRRPVADGFMVEDIAVYHAVVPQGVEPVNRDGEVERFECLAGAALHERLAADAFTLEASLVFALLMEQGTVAGRPCAPAGKDSANEHARSPR